MRSPAPEQRSALLERLRSSESPIRDVYRHARKHPRVTLGTAAGTAAAVIGVTAGLSATASPVHHTAEAPFPAAHAAPVVTGGQSAAPAITPSAPAPAVTDHSVAHAPPAQPKHQPAPAQQAAPAKRSAQAQPAQAQQPAPVRLTAPAPQASPAKTAAAQPAAGKLAAGKLAAPAQHAAPASRAGKQRTGKAAVSQRGRQHQGPGAVVGHLTQHKNHAGHAAWHGHRAAKKAWPYLIYDSVTPTAIPSHHVVATYATGPYAASPSDVAGRKAVLWIDTHGTDPQAAALDVEPGDATPSMAASWAWQRLHAHPREHAIIYTMRSEWAAAQASIGTLPHWMQNHVRWWIADPTGYPHVVPGSNATQWYWGTHYDITTATPGF